MTMQAKALALAVTLALLGACAKQDGADQAASQPIRIDGSSTVFPVSQAVAAAYRAANATAPEIQVAESGTTGGFEKFCAGQTEITGASRPITTREMIACFRGGVRYVEAPIAFDGITVIVNPSNPVTSITMEQLRAIWGPDAQGAVTTWRAVSARWPDAPLTLHGPGPASGTFDYFTEAVMGEAGKSRTDYTASEDDDQIVAAVAATPSALAYLGHAYFQRNRAQLHSLAVDSGDGPVEPSLQNITSGEYSPLSRPIFVYVNIAALDRPEVQAFAEYFITAAGRASSEVGYVSLPESAYSVYLERVQSRRAGTAFSGRSALGATIEQVIGRPLIEASS